MLEFVFFVLEAKYLNVPVAFEQPMNLDRYAGIDEADEKER